MSIGAYLYQLTVDSTGVTAAQQIGTGIGGSTLQYDNGRLYVPNGVVFSATSGAQLGQFSTLNSYSTTLGATVGPIFSDSALNRVWIAPMNYDASTGQVLAFDSTTFNPVASITVAGFSTSGYPSGPADLIRWGQNGLAFHTQSQLYVLHGPIVKDISDAPADLAVSVSAPATTTTGSTLTWTVKVENRGPGNAQGITLHSLLPQSVIAGTVEPSQGSCNGPGEFYCDLGSLAPGDAATVKVSVTPSTAATAQLTATVDSVSYDPVSSNDQASATTAITGSDYNPAPTITQLSPALIPAGSGAFVLTVDGMGFTADSTVLWNGQQLPTTYLSSGQLTADVDASLVANLGWSSISVSTPTPGGGESAAFAVSIYQVLDVPATALAYDPFTRKLYATVPSSATNMTGNSIVAIDPARGNVGTPINAGSEPNLLSETSDGNYFYIGLSGAKSLGRFDLQTQSVDATIPIPAGSPVGVGSGAAIAIATVPGSDTSLAIEEDSFDGIGILDISGRTGSFRKNSTFGYAGDNPVFVDASHFYAYDSYTSGAEFYRYSIDGSGVENIDSTTLQGMGGFGGKFAVDRGWVYGVGGGILNPTTTPPSQIAVLPFGSSSTGNSNTGASVVPYGAESKCFNVVTNFLSNGAAWLERFDTQRFTLDAQLPLPGIAAAAMAGVRWGQDGLAFILPGSQNASSPASIFLIQGPFVLPAEAETHAAPSLSKTDQDTITAGTGNLMLTITGSGFLPGATVLWNDSWRTTTWVDSTHLSVAIPASDVQKAAGITVSARNPGSDTSNSLAITVQ
jgi:uncharacterized repeat protein (TIGR01451 family)